MSRETFWYTMILVTVAIGTMVAVVLIFAGGAAAVVGIFHLPAPLALIIFFVLLWIWARGKRGKKK